MLRQHWLRKDSEGRDYVESPIDLAMRQDLTGVKRNWLECHTALVSAYAETLGLDLGRYYVGLADQESTKTGMLLHVRLENYRKLCIREFLGLSFQEYLDNPRYIITEYDAAARRWLDDPEIAKLMASSRLGLGNLT